jgi:hypothetical protein
MTPDIKTQLESIESSKPSLHKIDKKVSILIFQVLDMLEKHNNLRQEFDIVKNKQTKDGSFVKGAAWVFGVLFSALTGWMLIKK